MLWGVNLVVGVGVRVLGGSGEFVGAVLKDCGGGEEEEGEVGEDEEEEEEL